jgi:hypothetical protein
MKKKIGKKACVRLARQLARKTGVCSKCGRTKGEVQIQAAHIVPEEHHWLSFGVHNMIELCASCHKWSGDSWHKNPVLMARWFENKYPGRYDELMALEASLIEENGPVPDWAIVHQNLKQLLKGGSKNAGDK